MKIIETLSVEQIVDKIIDGSFPPFDKLRIEVINNDIDFGNEKQNKVKALLNKRDDEAFARANTITALNNYIEVFPKGIHVKEAKEEIGKIQEEENEKYRKQEERERMLRDIVENINEYTPNEIKEKLSKTDIEEICKKINIDYKQIEKFSEPTLSFNDIPQEECDIPEGYTDVFFWGIPSSGKTCALSAIFSSIKKNYNMEAPDCSKKYGATYRDSLVNIFSKEWGYLPARTNTDKTQYMPFLFYNRGEKSKRRISFFELSGEVFKFFYEKANHSQIIDDYNRDDIQKSFQTLELLLKSDNQKIHFFFIDYNQESRYAIDRNGLTQSNYLEAAATYFRDNKEIFKKKTDAVYVVITKADEIEAQNEEERMKLAGEFLKENFGSFVDVLRNQCETYSVEFKVKIFSIGNVYFKQICKINREYSIDIINDLLNSINVIDSIIKGKIKKFFNS